MSYPVLSCPQIWGGITLFAGAMIFCAIKLGNKLEAESNKMIAEDEAEAKEIDKEIAELDRKLQE